MGMPISSTEPSLRGNDSNHRSLFRALTRVDRSQHRTAERKRRWMRGVLAGIAVLACVAVVGLLLLTITMRHAMRASLPQVDGSLVAEGLTAAVTVTRDAQGVPSIQAANLDDLLFAQGYTTAQDRLWQMDALRRHGAGELAEILGPSMLQHDRLQRYLQVRAAADRALTVLPPDQLHQLEAYARGVNAFIAAHADTLPVEFHLLHYKPAPWSPRDSLLIGLVMSQDLSTSFPQKLNREALSGHLPAALLQDLYPVGSWRDRPPSQTALDLTTPTDSVEQIPLDKTQARNEGPAQASARDLMATYTVVQDGTCDGCRAGSNNWAVSGAHTASGAPMLSNDMHLGLTLPDIWYEATLHAASTPLGVPLDVSGLTLPGVPLVIVGRNAHVAWGFTNTGSAVQDVRIEHLRGSGPNTEYERVDGTWGLAGHQVERIRVRGGRDETLDVLTTTMSVGAVTMATPVISPLYPSERRVLSLAWNVYDPANITLPFLEVDCAQDGASLVASFGGFGGPSENLVYADPQHIGFHVLGRIPIRGPAVQRPRVQQQFVLPDRTPDSDDEDEDGPTALTTSSADTAHIARTAWLQDQVAPATSGSFTIGSPIANTPVDALDAMQVWSGYIPYNELPSVRDPEGGVLATANARVTQDDYPYFVNDNWADPYRVERIDRLLEKRTGLRPAEMLGIETDVHSEFDLMLAQRLAYALDHASTTVTHQAPQLRQAADLLRRWNGQVVPDSSAAAIVASTHTALWSMLLVPQIERFDAQRAHAAHNAKSASAAALSQLYTWGERNTALEQLLQHTPQRWLPPHMANWNDLLAAAVIAGLRADHAPANLSAWHYSSLHRVEIVHPVFGISPLFQRLLGVRTGSGAQPIGGDHTTVQQTDQRFGPSERFTADMANADATTMNITTGESGNPASPWYLDQFAPWLHGRTFAVPLWKPAAMHTLRMSPR
jgi:penicillin amidase